MLHHSDQFGNVKRLKRVMVDGEKILWYSGDKTFKLLEIESFEVVATFDDVIDGLPNESIGFYDVLQNNYLVVSSYALDKRPLYLYDMHNAMHVMKRRMFENPFRSMMLITLEIFWKDYQYFNGCVSHSASLVVLGGKVERNLMFSNNRMDVKKEWEGAIFTYKLKDCGLYECEPFVVIHSDEPVYQLKVLEDQRNPIFICTTRTKRLFIAQFNYLKEQWAILRSVAFMNEDRRILFISQLLWS